MSHWVVCPQALGRPSASGREAAGLAQHRAREGRGARDTWSRSSEDHTERPGSVNGLRRSLASSRPSNKVVRVRILDNIEADLWQRGLPQAPRSSVQAPVRSLKPGSRPPKARPVARQELDTSFESSPSPGICGPEAKAEFLESIEGSVPLSQSQAQVGAVVTGPHPPEREPPPVQGGEASLEGSSLEEKRGFEAAFEALDQWHTGVESSLSRVEEALGGVSQLSSELSSLQEELNQLLRECDHAFPTKEEASLPRAEQDGEDRNNNYNNNNEKNAIVLEEKEEEQKKDLVAFTFAGVVVEEEPEPSVCGGQEGTGDVRKQQEGILQGEKQSQQNGGGQLISAGGVGLDGGRGSQKRHIFQVPRAVRSRRSRNLTKSKRFQKHVRSTLPTVVEEEPPLLLPGPSGCTKIVLRSAPSVAIGGQTDLDCVAPGWNGATSGGVDQVSAQEAMPSRMEIACTLPVHICLNLRGLDMNDVMTGLGSVSNFLREKDPTLQMCGVVSSDTINVVLRRAPVPSVLEFPGKLKGMLGGSINPRRPGACCRGVGFICKGREVFEYCGCDGIGRPSQTGAAAARDEDFVESNRNAQKLRVARVLPMGAVISCGLAPRNASTLASVAGGLVGERSLMGSLRINEIVDLAPKSRLSTLDSARRHANNKDETARSDLYNVIVSKRKRRIMMSRRGTLDRCDGFKARNRTLRTQDSASDFDSFNIRVAEDSALLDNVTESFSGVDDNAPAGMENNFPKRYSDFEDLNGAENNANCEQQGPAGGWGSSLSYGETVAVLYATEGGRIAMFTSAENNKCGNRAKEQQQQQENNTSGWRDQLLQGLISMAGGGAENDGSPDMDMEEDKDDAEFSGRDVQEFELVDLNKREGGKLRASEITFAGMAVEAMAADSAWIKRLWNTCRDAVRSCFAVVFGQLLGVG